VHHATPSGLRALLKAPICERETLASTGCQAESNEDLSAPEGTKENVAQRQQGETNAPLLPEPAYTAKHAAGTNFDEAGDDITTTDSTALAMPSPPPAARKNEVGEDEGVVDDEDSDGAGFLDMDTVPPAMSWEGSQFVRAWGVLASWLTDLSKEALLNGTKLQDPDEESRPERKTRRDLLVELLMDRLPGDAAFLSRRLHDVAMTLGVHQTLPSISEAGLWDLLAAMLVRAVLRCDIKRGSLDPNPFCERVLSHQVNVAAKDLGLSKDELASLAAMLPDVAMPSNKADR